MLSVGSWISRGVGDDAAVRPDRHPIQAAMTSSHSDYGGVITPHESVLSGTRRPRDTQRTHAYPLDGRPDTDQWERPD